MFSKPDDICHQIKAKETDVDKLCPKYRIFLKHLGTKG